MKRYSGSSPVEAELLMHDHTYGASGAIVGLGGEWQVCIACIRPQQRGAQSAATKPTSIVWR